MIIGTGIKLCWLHKICLILLMGFWLKNANGMRNISVQYNPGCDIPLCTSSNLSVHLIYARSEGNEDSLHYVVSTVGPSFPTVVLLKSRHREAYLFVDWTRLIIGSESGLQGAIQLVNGSSGETYNDEPETAVYFLSQILGYSDNADNVDINDPSNVNVTSYMLNNIQWNITHTNNSAAFMGTDDSSPIFNNETMFVLNFDFYDADGRENVLPRLAYNEKSARLEIILKNFAANFSNPRFAMLVHVANPQNTSATIKPVANSGCVDKLSSRTIDDEYAPSVFTSTDITWQKCGSSAQENFWRWRTVCYTDPSSVRKYSTDVKSVDMRVMNFTNSSSMLENNRLLVSYFGRQNLDKLLFNTTTISFGKPEDDFYTATNYISWTTLMGFGVPPGDSLSLLIIGILLAGVVLPILVIIGGAIFMLVRKCKRQSNRKAVIKAQYEPIG